MTPAVLAATLLGVEVTADQAYNLGALLLGMVVGVLLLMRLARALRQRGMRGAGLLLFCGLIYLPLIGFYTSVVILNFHQNEAVVTNPKEVEAGLPPVYDQYGPAKVLLFLIILIGIYILVSLMDELLFTRERENRLGWRVPKILREILRWVMVATGAFLAAARIWNFQLDNLAIFGGALTVGLSIALGPTLGAFISGITIAAERPFELGDWIEVEGKQGRVDQITWRSTRIITRDNESVVYPNSKLAEWRIINLSRPDPKLGVRCHVGVHYRTPPLETREALRHAVQGTPGVLAFPDPSIRLKEYGDSSINWEIRFWIDDPQRLEEIKADVMQRIWYSFNRANIEIPYPIRNMVMREKEWDAPASPTKLEEKERRKRNVELLKKVPILGPLPEADLDYIAARAPDEVYLEGERITVEGEPGDRMYIIVSGKARVTVEMRGTREIAVLVAGEFFGEMSLLTGCNRVATVVALDELRVVSLRAETLKPVLVNHPEFAKDMAEFAAARKMQLEELAVKVEEGRVTGDFETTSTNLLGEIMKFFKLPGR